jgi:hypothetical protein
MNWIIQNKKLSFLRGNLRSLQRSKGLLVDRKTDKIQLRLTIENVYRRQIGGAKMLYPFMTLEDNTEIVHSEALTIDGKEQVKVCIEKPVFEGFHSAECWLPEYRWDKVNGFSQEEIEEYQKLLESLAHIIIRLSREGGFDNAANF